MFWIYLITNLVNGKIYVGQHSGPDLQAYLEFNLHAAFLQSRRNNKPILYRAMRKYEASAFTISCLFQAPDKRQQNEAEKFLIRLLASRQRSVGYNLAEGGTGGNTREGYTNSPEHCAKTGAALKGRPKSDEHCRKISVAKTGTVCPEVSAANIARRSSNPTPAGIRNRLYRERQKLRAAGIMVEIVHPWIGKKHSEETKAKMSAASKGRPKSTETRAKISAAKLGVKLGPRKEKQEAA